MNQALIEKLLTLALESKPEAKESSASTTLINLGNLKICILQRGWVFVGKYFQSGDNCWLEDASCIRIWGTTKGLGELAEKGPTFNTKLDPCPTVRFHALGVVATIDCNQTVWKNK